VSCRRPPGARSAAAGSTAVAVGISELQTGMQKGATGEAATPRAAVGVRDRAAKCGQLRCSDRRCRPCRRLGAEGAEAGIRRNLILREVGPRRARSSLAEQGPGIQKRRKKAKQKKKKLSPHRSGPMPPAQETGFRIGSTWLGKGPSAPLGTDGENSGALIFPVGPWPKLAPDRR